MQFLCFFAVSWLFVTFSYSKSFHTQNFIGKNLACSGAQVNSFILASNDGKGAGSLGTWLEVTRTFNFTLYSRNGGLQDEL